MHREIMDPHDQCGNVDGQDAQHEEENRVNVIVEVGVGA